MSDKKGKFYILMKFNVNKKSNTFFIKNDLIYRK